MFMSSDLRRLRYARGHRTRNKTGRGRQVIHSAFLASCGSNNNNNLTTMTWPKSGMWLSKRTLQPMWGTLTSLSFRAVLRHMIKNTMQLKTATASRLPAEFVQGAFLAAANWSKAVYLEFRVLNLEFIKKGSSGLVDHMQHRIPC